MTHWPGLCLNGDRTVHIQSIHLKHWMVCLKILWNSEWSLKRLQLLFLHHWHWHCLSKIKIFRTMDAEHGDYDDMHNQAGNTNLNDIAKEPLVPLQPQDSMEELSLHTLPTELFLHICSFLRAKFVIRTLSQVCRLFRDLIMDDTFWKVRMKKRWPKPYPVVPGNIGLSYYSGHRNSQLCVWILIFAWLTFKEEKNQWLNDMRFMSCMQEYC